MGVSQSKEDNFKTFVELLRSYNEDNEDNEYKYQFLDFSLNMVLVYCGARDAYLLETSNFGEREDKSKMIEKCLKYVEDLGFYMLLDPQSIEGYPRYFITKFKIVNVPEDDESVGTLLGMKDPGEEYYDYRNDRTILKFVEVNSNVEIMSQIVKSNENKKNIEYAEYKIGLFNKVMNEVNLPYRFMFNLVTIEGTYRRQKELKLKNMNYIKEHKEEYIDDLSNGLVKYPSDQHTLFVLFDRCVNNKKMFNTFLPLFLEFYSLFNTLDINIEENQRILNEKMVDIIEDSL